MIVGLARVSTSQQDLNRQLDSIQRYSKSINDKNLKIYSEKVSGTLQPEERSELQKMIDFIDNPDNGVEHIIFAEMSRLGRNAEDILRFIRKYNEKQICIHILDKDIKTLKEDKTKSETTDLLVKILAVLADLERTQILQRMADGKDRSVLVLKKWSGGTPPYGYTTDENYQLIPHPEQSIHLKKIFELYADGFSTIKISNFLNENNIKTRYGKKTWKEGSLRQLLQNPLYVGKRMYKEQEVGSPPLVSEDLFNRVQLRFEQFPEQRKKRKYYYIINSKIIKCIVCGRNYVYVNRQNTEALNCSSHRYDFRCENNGIGITRLYNSIYHTLKIYSSQIENKDLEEEKKNINIEIKNIQFELNDLKSKQSQVESRRKRIRKSFQIDEEYSEIDYKNDIEKLNNDKGVYDKEIPLLTDKLNYLKSINIEEKYIFNIENKDRVNTSIKNLIKEIKIYPVKNHNLTYNKRKSDNYVLVELYTFLSTSPRTYLISSYSNLMLKLTPKLFRYDKDSYSLSIDPIRAENSLDEIGDYKEYWNYTEPK